MDYRICTISYTHYSNCYANNKHLIINEYED
jgi:hypothetical protein